MSKQPECATQPAAFTTAEIAEFDRLVPRYQLDPVKAGLTVHWLSLGASSMRVTDSWPTLHRPEADAAVRCPAIDGFEGPDYGPFEVTRPHGPPYSPALAAPAEPDAAAPVAACRLPPR